MTPYANLSGDAGVVSYEVAPDSIIVQFQTGDVYVYTYKSAGKHDVEQTKRLARSGKGLSTFISTKIKHRYARKLT